MPELQEDMADMCRCETALLSVLLLWMAAAAIDSESPSQVVTRLRCGVQVNEGVSDLPQLKCVTKHQHPAIKGVAPDLLMLGWEKMSAGMCACCGCKYVKYGSSEGCHINVAAPTFSKFGVASQPPGWRYFIIGLFSEYPALEAEWLSIMFVRGNFIEEHWDWIGCRCVEEVGARGPPVGEGGGGDYMEFAGGWVCR